MISNLCLKINQPIDNYEIAFTPTPGSNAGLYWSSSSSRFGSNEECFEKKGIDPNKINPLSRVDLIIDHSVMVDHFGDEEAYEKM